jgi:hypothetical protein
MGAKHLMLETKKQRDVAVGIGDGLGLPIVFALGAALTVYRMRRRRLPVMDYTASDGVVTEVKSPETGIGELQAPDVELQAARMEVELP